MSEIRRDEIIYEEGWRDADIPVQEDDDPDAQADIETKPELPKEDHSPPLLTILQLILCMIAALVLFILKAMDSDAYHDFMNAYDEEMAKPVISQKVFDAVDWNALFGGSQVSVKATPDELSHR